MPIDSGWGRRRLNINELASFYVLGRSFVNARAICVLLVFSCSSSCTVPPAILAFSVSWHSRNARPRGRAGGWLMPSAGGL